MSSRAMRRLQQQQRTVTEPEPSTDEGSCPLPTRKSQVHNPFSLVRIHSNPLTEEMDSSSDSPTADDVPVINTPSTLKKNNKKSKAKIKAKKSLATQDVDAALQEVNQLLGAVKVRPAPAMSGGIKSILSVDRRLLNAHNEMRKIFGSRVVRKEDRSKKSRKRVHHRTTVLATPRDTWPKMDKPGLSMRTAESNKGCQYFVFEHSKDYRKVQFKFWEATETFDPNAIAAILHAHPYHIDSLLQLSEVCKMSEDVQMAAELVERALFCFECSFHTMFNMTQGNCRLRYSVTENRSFFIALFRHLNYVGARGCHRTALEFCKLLLSLDPEGDPLCILLMIDYHALRAQEYTFLIDLLSRWEPDRNLSQLPNFSFSVPLAQFHCQSSSSEPDRGLQDALIMFPSLLIPLLDKCSVTFDASITKHHFFSNALMMKDSKSLQVLLQLYIERAHSVWKEPEVLTWLEANCRHVLLRVDSGDPLVTHCVDKRRRRFVGTPRNIQRHIVISDFDQIAAMLSREVGGAVLSYDPLPPSDSVSAYSRPQRQVLPAGAEDENPFMLFLRSMLPTFSTQPQPVVREHRLEGAMGGAQQDRPHPQEGDPGRPFDVEATVQSLVRTLQDMVQYVPPDPDEEGGWSSDSD